VLFMAGLEAVFSRIANDPSFADAVRADPVQALRGYQLDPAGLARVAHALGIATTPPAPLFTPPAEH
jgi:hypothetical protein